MSPFQAGVTYTLRRARSAPIYDIPKVELKHRLLLGCIGVSYTNSVNIYRVGQKK